MPTTIEQREKDNHSPAGIFGTVARAGHSARRDRQDHGRFCSAVYELSGINSYYHSDDGRQPTKVALEALIRSLPERSMRMQVRFEITEGLGDVARTIQATTPKRKSDAAGP